MLSPPLPARLYRESAIMRAVIVHAAKDLRIGAVDVPVPRAGEVRVRIEAGGICGSDLHSFHEGRIGTITLKEPMVLGHEVRAASRALAQA